MDPVNRVREARKQTDIAYGDLGSDAPEGVLADLAAAEERLQSAIGKLEEGA